MTELGVLPEAVLVIQHEDDVLAKVWSEPSLYFEVSLNSELFVPMADISSTPAFQPYKPSPPSADDPQENTQDEPEVFEWTIEDLKAFVEEYHPTNLNIDLSLL
jgi:hypothetical protein